MKTNKKIIGTAAIVAAAVLSVGGMCPPCLDTGVNIAINAEAASVDLPAPQNIKASASANSVTLKWNKVSGADGYRVYMYDSDTKKYKCVKTVKGNKCTVDGLEFGDRYTFKVAAAKKTNGKYKSGTLSGKIKAAAVYSGEGLYEGVWIAGSKNKVTGYYKLNSDGTGSYRNADIEIGLGFNYEKTKSGYLFHMGGADDNSSAKVSVSVETGIRTVKWSDGRTEYLRLAPYQDTDAGTVIACPLFSLMLPTEADFETQTDGNSIAVYDYESKNSGFGGFAFKISAYKKPSDYYGVLDSKIGELRTGSGEVYDIVIQYPSDVQYDIEKYSDGAPKKYDLLYKGADEISQTLSSTDGGRFVFGAGTTGEELYGDVLAKHYKALTEKWDSEKLSKENMSTLYGLMSLSDPDSVLDKLGYAYFDINGDGIDELLIGEVINGENVIYDVYTMKDRKPVHVVSGGERSRWYTFEHGMLCNEYSNSAFESGSIIYDLEHNSSELDVQVDFRYDTLNNKNNPCLISYTGEEGDYEQVSEKEFNQRRSNYGKYKKFKFTPFSSFE